MSALIDLTHIIYPEHTPRRFSVETIGAETVNKNVVRLQGQWYIMSKISMVSHIATHIEVPYHLFPDGCDLASLPLEICFGQAVLLDFTHIQKRVEVSLEEVKEAAERIGGIPEKSIVLCNLGYSSRYGTEEYSQSPYFSARALQWLADSGMKLMGVDAGGVEIPGSEEHGNHGILFSNRIPLIENVAHLELLPVSHFQVAAFPYPIKGVEAFPVRVVAFL